MKYPIPIKRNIFPGYIYLIRLDNSENTIYKIGQTGDVIKRLTALCCETGRRTLLIAYGYTDNAIQSETTIHNIFSKYRIRGEYYRFSNGQLITVINEFRKTIVDVETDYSDPTCPIDECKLIIIKSEKLFRCPNCDYTVSFGSYMEEPIRMLPYQYNELKDDEGGYHNIRRNHIYDLQVYDTFENNPKDKHLLEPKHK